MKALRVRKFGSDEWTTLRVEGEFEDEIAGEILPLVDEAPDTHVQIWNDDEGLWEDAE